MTLQPPQPVSQLGKKYLQHSNKKKPILCHKCGAEIIFDKKFKTQSTNKLIPLDPFFNNQPHKQYCMYDTTKYAPDTEFLLTDFVSRVKSPKPPKPVLSSNPHNPPKQVLFAVGRAKE